MTAAIGGIEVTEEECIGCDVARANVQIWLTRQCAYPFRTWYLCACCLVTCSSDLGKWGRHHWRTSFLLVLVEYRVLIFRVKTQDLAFIDCTWQCPCRRQCFENSDFLQGENLRSSIGRRQRLCIVPFLKALLLEKPIL